MSLKNLNPVDPNHRKRIAIVLSNPAVSTTTGWPVGFWWSELSHPYYVFDEAGYGVELFSPNGGRCEADAMSDPRDASGYSANDLISMGFIATPRLIRLVENTRPVAELAVDELKRGYAQSDCNPRRDAVAVSNVTWWSLYAMTPRLSAWPPSHPVEIPSFCRILS